MGFLKYRSAADRAIDHAQHKVAQAEMSRNHSYTKEQIAAADADLAAAKRYLARAEKAKEEWESKPRGDYEEFPGVREHDQVTVEIRGSLGTGTVTMAASAWDNRLPCGQVLLLHEARRDLTAGKPFDILSVKRS